MMKFHLILSVLAMCLVPAKGVACDLRVTILPHTDRLMFGDPLYLEVTLTNQGDDPIAGPPPDLMFGTLGFMICDEQAQLCYKTSAGGGMVGGMTMRVFEPHTSVKYYFTFMFPRYRRFDHVFWSRYIDGGGLSVRAIYRPRRGGGGMMDNLSKNVPAVAPPGGQIVSDRAWISVDRRPKRQIERLQFWVEREIDPKKYKKGPTPSHFGLPVHVANREEMGSFAFDTVLDGELGGLAVLSLKFRDIYDLPPESREAVNGELVEWLRKEPPWKRVGEAYMIPRLAGGLEPVHLRPEIKRMALAHLLRGNAQSYNMRSTAAAMKELIEEPAFAGDETTQEDGVD